MLETIWIFILFLSILIYKVCVNTQSASDILFNVNRDRKKGSFEKTFCRENGICLHFPFGTAFFKYRTFNLRVFVDFPIRIYHFWGKPGWIPIRRQAIFCAGSEPVIILKNRTRP